MIVARILVIDENCGNLDLMQYLLTALGHAALTPEYGAAGIAAAPGEREEMIVCDVHMPGTDGYAVAQAIRRGPNLRQLPTLGSRPIEPQRFIDQVPACLTSGRNRGDDPGR